MKRVPEPALIRSILVAVTGIIALVVGKAIDVTWVDSVVTVYAALTPIIAGVLIRSAVTPVKSAHSQADK